MSDLNDSFISTEELTTEQWARSQSVKELNQFTEIRDGVKRRSHEKAVEAVLKVTDPSYPKTKS